MRNKESLCEFADEKEMRCEVQIILRFNHFYLHKLLYEKMKSHTHTHKLTNFISDKQMYVMPVSHRMKSVCYLFCWHFFHHIFANTTDDTDMSV